MKHKRLASAVVAIAIAALFIPVAIAEEEKAKGPELDEGAKKLMEGWKTKRYHLADQGLKKASCNLSVKANSPMGAMAVDGSYVWDGAKSTLKWKDPAMGALMEQGGPGLTSMFEEWFDAEKFNKDMAGAKITSSQDGEHTLLKVEGKTESGLSEMRFDKEGVLRKVVIKMDNPQAGEMTMKFDVKHEDVDGKLLQSGYEGTLTFAMGEVKIGVTLTFETKGKYRIPVKLVNSSDFGGQKSEQAITFSDWKFDDDVK